MKISDAIEVLERVAPLDLQEDYDNSGLQVGFPDRELTGILVCVDVTEDIIDEAVSKGCNLVVSHHPLLFKPLKRVCGDSIAQRCVVKAIESGTAVYSSHTCLDNAPGGVNFKIAETIGVRDLDWIEQRPGEDAGSGVIGELSSDESQETFLSRVANLFDVECLRHSVPAGTVRKVAICGGAGAFLMSRARELGADCFVCGEFRYHDYFDNEGMLLVELGHYQSERFTVNLIADVLSDDLPGVRVEMTEINTNPICYDA